MNDQIIAKTIDKLTLIDDEFMIAVFDDNPEAVRLVRYFKETEGGQRTMSTAMDEFRTECERESRRKRDREIALNCIKEGNIPYEQIARLTGLTLDEVKALAEGASA